MAGSTRRSYSHRHSFFFTPSIFKPFKSVFFWMAQDGGEERIGTDIYRLIDCNVMRFIRQGFKLGHSIHRTSSGVLNSRTCSRRIGPSGVKSWPEWIGNRARLANNHFVVKVYCFPLQLVHDV